MKNFQKSDYALNKLNEGIVYPFADGSTETVTLARFLAENPNRTESDFLFYKKFSDSNYFTLDRSENAQTKKNTPFDDLVETDLCYVPSPEELHFDEINMREETESREQQLKTAKQALNKLTEVQRRRYLMYRIDELTTREIAEKEGVNQSKIVKSLAAAKKKIKKFLESS